MLNNAFLLVDHSNLLLGRGMALEEAVKEAGKRRLRPILMTALTTILARVPLALGPGEGGRGPAAARTNARRLIQEGLRREA